MTFIWLNLFHVLNGKEKVSVCVEATKLCKPLRTKDLLYMYTLNMIYVGEMPSTSMAKEKQTSLDRPRKMPTSEGVQAFGSIRSCVRFILAVLNV